MVITNSCSGALCYINEDRNINYQYNNPFIGSGIYADSWYKLLKNFDSIDFHNVRGENKYSAYHLRNINYLILENSIEIRFTHKSNLNEILDNWHRRADRLINFLKVNKESWEQKVLFVSTSYKPDKDEDLINVAESFPNLHQLIDIHSREYLYDIIPFASNNTILFNKSTKYMKDISNYVIDHYFNYITDDYEAKK